MIVTAESLFVLRLQSNPYDGSLREGIADTTYSWANLVNGEPPKLKEPYRTKMHNWSKKKGRCWWPTPSEYLELAQQLDADGLNRDMLASVNRDQFKGLVEMVRFGLGLKLINPLRADEQLMIFDFTGFTIRVR